MKTKDKVLQILIEKADSYISGQEIADAIFVTRASVWKAINALRSEGHDIDAVTNKGYRIRLDPDEINVQLIMDELTELGIDIKVKHLCEVTSTNDFAIAYARENHESLVVIADKQTDGRGRRGRRFYSPSKSGLYMSLLIYPNGDAEKIAKVTAITAVATALSIDDVAFSQEDKTQIKWVNDIYINDRKVAGILTEKIIPMEDEDESCLVIGIGINVYYPKERMPKSIEKIAGSIITDNSVEIKNVRNSLAVQIVKRLYEFLENKGSIDEKSCLNIYRKKSFLIDNYVKIDSFNGESEYALAIGVDDEYHLIVRTDDGHTKSISSGEVSVVKY